MLRFSTVSFLPRPMHLVKTWMLPVLFFFVFARHDFPFFFFVVGPCPLAYFHFAVVGSFLLIGVFFSTNIFAAT